MILKQLSNTHHISLCPRSINIKLELSDLWRSPIQDTNWGILEHFLLARDLALVLALWLSLIINFSLPVASIVGVDSQLEASTIDGLTLTREYLREYVPSHTPLRMHELGAICSKVFGFCSGKEWDSYDSIDPIKCMKSEFSNVMTF